MKNPLVVVMVSLVVVLFCLVQPEASSFSLNPSFLSRNARRHHHERQSAVSAHHGKMSSSSSSSSQVVLPRTSTHDSSEQSPTSAIGRMMMMMTTTTALVVLMTTFGVFFGGPLAALADEYGVEKEAPTLLTGETVEICTKRGILGACLQTEMRTEQNDNDKAKKYFRDPSEMIREKEAVLRGTSDTTGSGENNALVEKLRQQTLDNRERNRLDVERRTFENDQSATTGPFDRQVIIMNTDGKTFMLLSSPQAMRLKSAGFINERRQFITQPTEQDLQDALEQANGEGLAGALQAIFGASST